MRILALLGLIALTACQQAPQQTVLPPISFSAQPPLRVAVTSVDVVDEYQSSGQKPHVEQQMVTSPQAMVHSWANDRMKAVGGAGRMEVVITDASVNEVALPVKEGMRGFFSDDQSARYDATLKVTIKLYDGVSTMSKAEADVQVTRSQTINEKATVAEREKLWHTMVTDMAASFNSEAESRIRQYFSPYLR